jgi:RNAse (barnase) inhibitor barstar
MSQNSLFSFAKIEACKNNHEDYYFAFLEKEINNQEQLFRRLYDVLQLPGYFGFNWNALYDCLTDFHWIKNKSIILYHEELPKLTQEELKIYLDLLRDAVVDWKDDDEHSLDVVFPPREKKRIIELLG